MIRSLRISGVARNATIIFAANLATQTTSLSLIAICGYVLQPQSFADLSLVSTIVILTVTFLDFGISVTVARLHNLVQTENSLEIACVARFALLVAGLIASALLGLAGFNTFAMGIAIGSIYSIWAAARANDVVTQDYQRMIQSTLRFVIYRAIGTLMAVLIWPRPWLIAFSLYALPVAAILNRLPTLGSLAWLRPLYFPDAAVIKYALISHAAQCLFIFSLYALMFAANHKLSDQDVSRLGLIITFSAPVTLLISSLRSAVLPKFLSRESNLEEYLWSYRGLFVLTLIWITLVLGGICASPIIEWVYEHRVSDFAAPFIVYYSCLCATNLLGLLSLSMHSKSVPQYALTINIVKVVALIPILYFACQSLIEMIAVTGALVVIGELVLTVAVRRKSL